jgi:hypothetical protein
MNNSEFEALVRDFRSKQDKLIISKGNDYTVQNLDRLNNFKFVGEQLGISPLKVLGVYWLKHVLAICTFIKFGKVESEDIEGRFLDESNYNLLGRALVSEFQSNESEKILAVAGNILSKTMPKVRKPPKRRIKAVKPQPGDKPKVQSGRNYLRSR